MALSYIAAKNSLSESDRAKLLCYYIHTKDGKTDWDKATAEYGSSSVNSFKTIVSTARRALIAATEKLENGDAAGDGTGVTSAGATDNADTPKKKGRKPRMPNAKKRARDAAANANGDGTEADGKDAKRARKAEDVEMTNGDGTTVKKEDNSVQS